MLKENITLSEHINNEIMKRGYTKYGFCDKAGIKYPTLARLSKHKPTYKTLHRIAVALSDDPEYVVMLSKLPITEDDSE